MTMIITLLTPPPCQRSVWVELRTSLSAADRLNTSFGGLFSSFLWREAGSGNAPACPITGSTSRHQEGREAFFVACSNALSEAAS